MLYFAHGSNMCTGRLRQRVPSAEPVCIAKLLNHSLRFHKRSGDGSAKADAYFTGEPADVVWGVVFEIDPDAKPDLDEYEGLSHGYSERLVTVIGLEGSMLRALMYAAEASHIDPMLRTYSWYSRLVVEGARQHALPPQYVARLEAIPATEDPDRGRDAANRRIVC